jgi:hypothetical protein
MKQVKALLIIVLNITAKDTGVKKTLSKPFQFMRPITKKYTFLRNIWAL